jgi:hypothetical protein
MPGELVAVPTFRRFPQRRRRLSSVCPSLHVFTSTAAGPTALGWVRRLGSRGSTASTATSSSPQFHRGPQGACWGRHAPPEALRPP